MILRVFSVSLFCGSHEPKAMMMTVSKVTCLTYSWVFNQMTSGKHFCCFSFLALLKTSPSDSKGWSYQLW